MPLLRNPRGELEVARGVGRVDEYVHSYDAAVAGVGVGMCFIGADERAASNGGHFARGLSEAKELVGGFGRRLVWSKVSGIGIRNWGSAQLL